MRLPPRNNRLNSWFPILPMGIGPSGLAGSAPSEARGALELVWLRTPSGIAAEAKREVFTKPRREIFVFIITIQRLTINNLYAYCRSTSTHLCPYARNSRFYYCSVRWAQFSGQI